MAWYMTENGPYNTDFIDVSESPMTKPYPKALWRIEAGRNGGLPFNELLPDIEGIDMWSYPPERVIRVYEMNEPQDGFGHNGLAVLEPTKCISEQELNGRWDLNLTHPLDRWGKWKNLINQNILKIDGQLLRINEQETGVDSSGEYIAVHAKQIWYDLADVLVEEAKGQSLSGTQAIQLIFNSRVKNSDGFHDYTFDYASGITEKSDIEISNLSIAAALIGSNQSFINCFGGELYRNNFFFSLDKTMRGSRQNAFSLRYGADMTKIRQKIDYSELVTHLICEDNYGNRYEASYTPGSYWWLHHQKTKKVFFTYSEYDFDRFYSDADKYWESGIGLPKVEYEIEFASIKNDPKYKDFVGLQDMKVGDSGRIYCDLLEIDTVQKIVYMKRDELKDEVISIKLGNIGDSIFRKFYKSGNISTAVSAEQEQINVMQTAAMSSSILGMQEFTIGQIQSRTINQLQGG